MNFKNSLVALALIFSSVAIAHNHHDLTKEELLISLIHAEKVNDNLVQRNKNLKAQVTCLKAEFDKIKHHLHEKHPFYELVKALVHLEESN